MEKININYMDKNNNEYPFVEGIDIESFLRAMTKQAHDYAYETIVDAEELPDVVEACTDDFLAGVETAYTYIAEKLQK